MPPKLSLLLFTYNNTEEAIQLIKELDPIITEVVAIEQSSPKKKELIREYSKTNRKLKLYDAVPLGDPGALRNYGLSKCTSPWILYLDIDEKLSPELHHALPAILEGTKADALELKRNETLVKQGQISYLTSRQIRVFRKGHVDYPGMVHESPVISGQIQKLEEDGYHIIHKKIDTDEDHRQRYFRIEAYTHRITYYIAANLLQKRGVSPTLITTIARLKNKPLDSEISPLEYKLFQKAYLLILFATKQMDLANLLFMNTYNQQKFKYFASFSPFQKEEQTAIATEIQQAGGVTKYLGLDDEKTIKTLCKRFKDTKSQPIDIFIKLLEERHKMQSTKKNPSIVAIITNWNGMSIKYKDKPILQTCLESVTKARYKNLHFVMIDAHSQDNSVAYTAKNFPEIKIMKTTDQGYAYMVNDGLKFALKNYPNLDFVVMVSNDLIFNETGWVEKMLAPFNLSSKIGMVGCRLLYPGGKVQYGGGKITPIGVVLIKDRQTSNTSRYSEYTAGALAMIKREVIESVGGYDALMTPFNWEDVDYAARVAKGGYKMYYVGNTNITHLESFSLYTRDIKKNWTKNTIEYYTRRNGYIYYLNHKLSLLPCYLITDTMSNFIKIDGGVSLRKNFGYRCSTQSKAIREAFAMRNAHKIERYR